MKKIMLTKPEIPNENHSGVLSFLISIIQMRNAGGLEHSDVTTKWTMAIAKRSGVSQDLYRQIEIAARVHDIGKIGISDIVLSKAGKFTRNEFESVQRHTVYGAELLSHLAGVCADNNVITTDVIQMVRSHHENFDGTGYPDKLRSNDIHIGARMIRIADSFAAMTTVYRPWRPTFTEADAIQMMYDDRNRYDITLLDIFREVYHE